MSCGRDLEIQFIPSVSKGACKFPSTGITGNHGNIIIRQ